MIKKYMLLIACCFHYFMQSAELSKDEIKREHKQIREALDVLGLSSNNPLAIPIDQIMALQQPKRKRGYTAQQWKAAKQVLMRPYYQRLSEGFKSNPQACYDAAKDNIQNQMETTARKRIEITEAIDRREINIKGIATIEARKRLELEEAQQRQRQQAVFAHLKERRRQIDNVENEDICEQLPTLEKLADKVIVPVTKQEQLFLLAGRGKNLKRLSPNMF